MVAALECTNCGFPLDKNVDACPFCSADLAVPGATMRLRHSPDVVSPQPSFEPPSQSASHNYESTYELDGYVPFDYEREEQEKRQARERERPSRFGPGARVVAVIAAIALVASVIGTTAWIALTIMSQH